MPDSHTDAAAPLWRYWRALCRDGAPCFARNLKLRVGRLALRDACSPLALHSTTVDDTPNAYSGSLTTQYVHYARRELRLLGTPAERVGARAAVGLGAGLLAMAQAERTVQWNAWLFSTNPLPPDIAQHVAAATDALQAQFPDRAVLVRNIDDELRPGCSAAFAAAGYRLIASRQVHHFDGRSADFLRRENTRRDRKLLTRQDGYAPCEHDDFDAADAPRIAALYRMVYIAKHSALNVDYADAFFLQAWRERWLEFRGLRHADGRIAAVMGCLRVGDEVSTPFLGYDTEAPPAHALYRRMVAMLLERTAERGERLNFSSGADDFKRRRGSVPSIEFNAVHFDHLPRTRRWAWAQLAKASERLGTGVLARATGGPRPHEPGGS